MSAPTPSDSSFAKKRSFGKYRELTHIATGGMGAVYQAWDPDLDRTVALKILSPEMSAKPNLLKRFEKEARLGSKLKHPNIARLLKFGKLYGVYYLALEFVEGINLHEYVVRQKQIAVRESRIIIIQAARALDHLHQHGIIHRDIKPGNFLIRHDNGLPLVKLIDLGLARRDSDEEEYRVTRAGSTLGTVDYLAPEQARDATQADIRSDIYSLGCTWFQLLAGRAPFAQGTVTERVYQHIHTIPPDVRDFNHDVPKGIVEILKRMLAKDPSHRYQTPGDLLPDLMAGRRLDQPLEDDLLAQLAIAEDEVNGVRPSPPMSARVQASGRMVVRRKAQTQGAVQVNSQPWWVMPTVVAGFLLALAVGVAIISMLADAKPKLPGPAPAAPPATLQSPGEPRTAPTADP